MGLQPGPEPALGAEQEDVDQAGDHRRDGEWQVDQGDQQALAREIEFGDGPGRGQAEDEIQRNGDRRHQQRQPDGGQRIGIEDRRKKWPKPLASAWA